MQMLLDRLYQRIHDRILEDVWKLLPAKGRLKEDDITSCGCGLRRTQEGMFRVRFGASSICAVHCKMIIEHNGSPLVTNAQ
jgi:hypothetical protein